jgi:hypothetical protein
VPRGLFLRKALCDPVTLIGYPLLQFKGLTEVDERPFCDSEIDSQIATFRFSFVRILQLRSERFNLAFQEHDMLM